MQLILELVSLVEGRTEKTIFDDVKKRSDGITLITIFWSLTSIIGINQGLQTLNFTLPMLPHYSTLFDTSAEIWMDYSLSEREWISFAIPMEIAIASLIITVGIIGLIAVYGLFTSKSWSFKLSFIIPPSITILSVIAVGLYWSAPYELYVDPELIFYSVFAPINVIWLIIMVFYLRKPKVKECIIGSPPLSLPLSTLHLGTRKGKVIKAILLKDRPLEWVEIQDLTGLTEKSLNYALFELIDSKEVHKIEDSSKPVLYKISEEIAKAHRILIKSRRSELITWIRQWKRVKKLTFSLENEHFFLEGRHLDGFSKELISNAKSEVLVVNPFIQECDLSNTLREIKKKGVDVQIITRIPQDKNPEHLKKNRDYLAKMKQDKISIIYKKKVHAKLIIIDRVVAIVSSMNFFAESSAGVSWEAGLVSIDPDVIESVVKSTLSKLV